MAGIQIRSMHRTMSRAEVSTTQLELEPQEITFPLPVAIHLILRAFTSNNWDWAKEQLELLAPNTIQFQPTIWSYQICAECKAVTPNNTYCPIVFCCIHCASDLGIYGHGNRYNWTQDIMFRFTKFPQHIIAEMHLALDQVYTAQIVQEYSLWLEHSKDTQPVSTKEL